MTTSWIVLKELECWTGWRRILCQHWLEWELSSTVLLFFLHLAQLHQLCLFQIKGCNIVIKHWHLHWKPSLLPWLAVPTQANHSMPLRFSTSIFFFWTPASCFQILAFQHVVQTQVQTQHRGLLPARSTEMLSDVHGTVPHRLVIVPQFCSGGLIHRGGKVPWFGSLQIHQLDLLGRNVGDYQNSQLPAQLALLVMIVPSWPSFPVERHQSKTGERSCCLGKI